MNSNISCSICLSENINIINSYITNCNHRFCKTCLENWFNNNKYTCPICRTLITEYKNNEITNNLIFIRNNSNIQNIRDISNNLNNNLFYQNMRLKICLSFTIIIIFFLSNFIFIFYSNNQYLINKCEKYVNCTTDNCTNDIEKICKL